MFYSLSKALLFLLQPITWLVVLVVWALSTKSRRKRKRLLSGAALLYLILGNPCLQSRVMTSLEWEPQLAIEQLDYAVLLGGYAADNPPTADLELNRAADRLTATIELYLTGKVERILVSSGVYLNEDSLRTEGALSKELLIRLGVPSKDILVEGKSWNTHQNAKYTAEILSSEQGSASFYLVTSAFHMKRAVACFEKEGLDPTPFPVDYHQSTHNALWNECLIPGFKTLSEWQVMIKEWVGWQVYALKGYI